MSSQNPYGTRETPPTLNGATRLFPIIGNPIAHVQSPAWLTRTFAGLTHDGVCVPMQVPEDSLDAVIKGLTATANVDGILVTMPHKHAAGAYCSTRTNRANLSGAVSVMRRNLDATWHGDMLDGLAFVRAQQDHGALIHGSRALLIGAGSAGSAIAIALMEAGIQELVLHDSKPSRISELLPLLETMNAGRARAGSANPSGFDLVFNATPLGMENRDPLPLDPSLLNSSMFVGDVVSGQGTSPLISAARAVGCRTATGQHMVQAVQDLMADFMLGYQSER